MTRKKLLLLGAGGHCRSVLDSIEKNKFSDIVIIDIAENVGQKVAGIPIAGTDKDLPDFYAQGYSQAFIALGSIGYSKKRHELYQTLKGCGFELIQVIDPSAVISENTCIGEGVFIGKGTIVNTGVEIGSCSIINTGAIIDHDCKIGRFSHLATGVSMSGTVEVGENAHIGTGSFIIQSIKIGSNVLLGAGSVVVSDIRANVVAFGNPCKIQRIIEVV